MTDKINKYIGTILNDFIKVQSLNEKKLNQTALWDLIGKSISNDLKYYGYIFKININNFDSNYQIVGIYI